MQDQRNGNGDQPAEPAGPASGEPTPDERNMALLAHLLGIFTWFVGALVIWLLKKDSSAYVAEHSREALNFQITVGIAWVVSGALVCLAIGMVLMPIVWLLNLVFCILATVAASKGEDYRYPVCIRVIQ